MENADISSSILDVHSEPTNLIGLEDSYAPTPIMNRSYVFSQNSVPRDSTGIAERESFPQYESEVELASDFDHSSLGPDERVNLKGIPENGSIQRSKTKIKTEKKKPGSSSHSKKSTPSSTSKLHKPHALNTASKPPASEPRRKSEQASMNVTPKSATPKLHSAKSSIEKNINNNINTSNTNVIGRSVEKDFMPTVLMRREPEEATKPLPPPSHEKVIVKRTMQVLRID